MSLNIKNKDAHRLSKKLAKITGESMSEAVTQAIRERLERVQGGTEDDLAARLLRIGKASASRFKESYRSIDHGEFLYDEQGLPK